MKLFVEVADTGFIGELQLNLRRIQNRQGFYALPSSTRGTRASKKEPTRRSGAPSTAWTLRASRCCV